MNKYGVKAGQFWRDNDKRIVPKRLFKVIEVEESYYPGGRASCELQGEHDKGTRKNLYLKLDRFNGTQRGYTLVPDPKKAKVKTKAKKKPAKKAGKKRRKR